MPQFTNLRLLTPLLPFGPSSSSSSLPILFKLKPLIKSQYPRLLTCNSPSSSSFTCLASYSKKRGNHSGRPFNLSRRNNTTLIMTEEIDTTNKKEMQGKIYDNDKNTLPLVGFNRKRLKGTDKSGPKDLKLKSRKLNPVSTICYVQVLGTGMDTQDTSPSVLLFFDKQRIMFNAGEGVQCTPFPCPLRILDQPLDGMQRFCIEHKIKLSKIDHIFLSRVCSETAGGLPGLLLTMAGMGDEGMSVNVWGPSDFTLLVDAMKSFIPTAAMVHTHSFGPKPSEPVRTRDPLVLIDDEVVKISAFQLQPTSMPNGSDAEAGSAIRPGDISVIYVCELPEIKGKFDPSKARALGLNPGPKYRELQLGNTVKSDRKNIMIHPSDVMDASIPGPIVLVIDCPTVTHLQELLSVQSLSTYYSDVPGNPEGSSKVNCVIHLSPSSIVNTSDYQKWMSRFVGAEHIMAGHEMKNSEVPILKSSAIISARLNYLCPQFFPAPGFWSLQHLKAPASSEVPVSKICEGTSAENLLKFHLRPYAQLGLDTSGVPAKIVAPEIIHDLLEEIPEIVDAAEQVSRLWQDNKILAEKPWLNGTESALPSCLENIIREDMEIVLLGTGSSQPSTYRNVTSIFINLFSKGSLLLDCGEGTLAQLKRRFGIEGADDAVRSLSCIWISHIHADHHTGLARVLTLRRDLLKGVPHEPLIVIGPRRLKHYLDAYERLEELDMEFLDCQHTTESSLLAFESNCDDQSSLGSPAAVESTLFVKGSRMQSYWKRPNIPTDSRIAFPILRNLRDVLKKAGLEALISVPVLHCPQAFGVVLKAADRVNSVGKLIPGWKIAYSGDTRPCPELVKAARGATVLIHEATFEDGLLDEAIAKNHSTTKEAVEVGDSAGVYRIILTHFSQRYPKIPVFDEAHMHKTCIAFDMMSVNAADLHVLPRVLPYLKLLFKNEMVADEMESVETAVSIAG